ncbi:MAG: hypothetical protein B7Y56_03210 [Gallionellales bacterium 35-53-114]|nr:MAG: hypothetical protein B7Y56_03210 [Gallionellales bacterium 35-53-114]OYZ65115.1 MAG: hypothetical protein B7Y04_00370 [Gallionellales bacterium 24-53-125]OZB08023.1 MAG: hypothetical protein B7X61_10820 [Gallionellales bacterium 39-52-133]
MDHFGTGAAMQGMAQMYFRSARQTGRTTSLVESVKSGDRIIFADSQEAERVRRLCLARGVKVDCVTVEPKTPERVFARGTPEGRTIFDHSWVEQFYLYAIEQTMRDIDHLERQSSGYGAAHRETKYEMEEITKWRL